MEGFAGLTLCPNDATPLSQAACKPSKGYWTAWCRHCRATWCWDGDGYWPLNGDRGGQQAPSLFTTIYDAPTAQAEGLSGRARAVVPLDTWREKVDAWLKARIGLLVTADDLTRDIGLPTEEDGTPTNNGIGGYIGGLARRGVLRLDHFENSTRVSSHARVFRVWLVVKAP